MRERERESHERESFVRPRRQCARGATDVCVYMYLYVRFILQNYKPRGLIFNEPIKIIHQSAEQQQRLDDYFITVRR